MIELKRLSGMRPQEVCSVRTIDIETSGRVWIFTPETHKTEHHDKERKIYLGPMAQQSVRQWLRADLAAPIFSPREAMVQRYGKCREKRKSPLTLRPFVPDRDGGLRRAGWSESGGGDGEGRVIR